MKIHTTSTTALQTTTIAAPGLYETITAAHYEADPCPAPSLTSELCRLIIQHQSPQHACMQHPRLGAARIETATITPDTPSLENLVCAELSADTAHHQIAPYQNYRTLKARQWRARTCAVGKTPLLEKDRIQARSITNALRKKAGENLVINPITTGKTGLTALWQETENWFRARIEKLIIDENGRAEIWDWRITNTTTQDTLSRTIATKGYHHHAAYQMRALRAVAPHLTGRITYTYCFVEADTPHAIKRVRLTDDYLALANKDIEHAIRLWKNALKTNRWETPVETIELKPPCYLAARHADAR